MLSDNAVTKKAVTKVPSDVRNLAEVVQGNYEDMKSIVGSLQDIRDSLIGGTNLYRTPVATSPLKDGTSNDVPSIWVLCEQVHEMLSDAKEIIGTLEECLGTVDGALERGDF